MSGINQHVIFSVTRLRAHFADDIGNIHPPVVGTGFFLKTSDGHNALMTNRHNIDPRLKLGANTRFRLARLDVELREVDATASQPIREACDVARPATRFFQLAQLATSVFASDTADCALVADPVWPGREEPYQALVVFAESDLADEAHFREHVRVMDNASFIGFPGNDGRHWWDEQWHLPIGRPASISSWPAVSFTNDAIPTSDTLLVAGHSFSGSSGSPVLAHRKGRLGGLVQTRVIGIMSGHFWERAEDTPKMFLHSGLSYLTRSTSIISLLATARAAGFRRSTPYDGLSPSAV